MLRATVIVRKAAVKEERVADVAWLDHQARASRGAAITSHGGLQFSLDLDRAAILNDGDAVKLEDGRLVKVRAAPERLLEIRADKAARLMRIAWQLGQRHVPAELTGEAIYVEDASALAELARGQGCHVSPVTRPFHPERSEDHVCEHHHSHAHHDHGHAGHDLGPHDHSHIHSGHDHEHDHKNASAPYKREEPPC